MAPGAGSCPDPAPSPDRDPRVDDYINALPDWQQAICAQLRELIHAADPEIEETIKRTVQPYFVLAGNVCALLAAKEHINLFLYDGAIVPDPDQIITGGHENTTARHRVCPWGPASSPAADHHAAPDRRQQPRRWLAKAQSPPRAGGSKLRDAAPAGTLARVSNPVASVLSDGTILELVRCGRIRIDPWEEDLVQPASVDLRLGDSFRVFHNHRVAAIDLREPPSGLTEEVVIGQDESFVIHPGEFCLGRTLEWVELPDDIVARIEGKSSIGRLGLIVHATAGFCDPGWKGTLTLELNNLTRVPIKLYPGLLIAQLSFMTLDRPALRPYGSAELGSHYQGQRAATESRYEGGRAVARARHEG